MNAFLQGHRTSLVGMPQGEPDSLVGPTFQSVLSGKGATSRCRACRFSL